MIHIIGAGLAGSEAAWQLLSRGHRVRLTEMRPVQMTTVHAGDRAAELVCSNSFKSDDPVSATGILKAEMRRMDSLILRCAEATRVPAGASLAVDRNGFSEAVTRALRAHPALLWETACVEAPDLGQPTLIATGPLTAAPMAEWLARATGKGTLHFYDAIAPIVERGSINMDIAWMASRYDKGTADFINCPLDREQYDHFLDALLEAERVPLEDVDAAFFEACLPIEVMADRGRETLRHGPMKPVGLDDPRTGRWPHAVVQLRQDSLAGDHFNMVGFQTRLRHGAQKEVFRLIPALEKAEFARYGSIHRNSYIQAPVVLDATSAVKSIPGLWIAGQVSGVDGYLESAASGLAAAFAMDRWVRGLPPRPFPRETMTGSLLHYLAHAASEDFGPTNAMIGLLPPLEEETMPRDTQRKGGSRAMKMARGEAHRARAMAALEHHLELSGADR